MAKKHFSIPDEVLEWLESEADKLGMNRSHYLTHLLVNVMQQQAKR